MRPLSAVLLALLAFAVVCEEPEVEAPEPQPETRPARNIWKRGADGTLQIETAELPAAALKALGEKYKIENASERCSTPGAAGQHDLFWELISLCEKDEKARADADVGSALQFLLFRANLARDPVTAEVATRKLPLLHEDIGAKLLDDKLKHWMTNTSLNANGSEPWFWPEYADIDRKALNKAVRRLAATGPKHNPVAKMWIALALLSADDPDAAKEIAAARTNLQKNMPAQAGSLYQNAIRGMAENGVRAALPWMLQQAEQEIAESAQMPEHQRFNNSLPRIYQLLGWPASNNPNPKQDFPRVKEWLDKNIAGLKWDRNRRRFLADAPPPGMEALYTAAQTVEKAHGIKCLDLLLTGGGNEALLLEVFKLIQAKPETAKDAAVGELLVAVFGSANRQYVREDMVTQLNKIIAVNAELGAKLWAQIIRQSFVQNPQYGPANLTRQLTKGDAAAVNAAFAMLAAEYQKEFEAAAKTGTPDQLLALQLQALYCGAKLEKKALAPLLEKAGADWTRRDGKLGQWASSMVRAGRTAGLRLQLLQAEREIAAGVEAQNFHTVRNFQHQAGWGDEYERSALTPQEQLARAEEWLNRNEAKLKYDENNQRFTGALSPEKEQLAALLEPFQKKYKLAEVSMSGNVRTIARTAFNALMTLLQANADAAKDESVGALVCALMDAGQMRQDESLASRLLVELPKYSTAAGVQVWSRTIRRSIDEGLRNNSVYSIVNTDRRYITQQPAIVAEARKALAPEMLKLWQDSAKDTPQQKLLKGVAALYVGAEITIDDLAKVLKDLEAVGDDSRRGVPQAAEEIVKSGNASGLSLLLLGAQTLPESRTGYLGRFEQLISYDGGGMRVHQLNEEQVTKRIEYYFGWLKENAGKLVWDPKVQKFKPPAPPTPPAVAPPQPARPAAVPPPPPPVEGNF